MKVFSAMLLCMSMALAQAGVTGELRYDCRMSGERNLTECCCAGKRCCASRAPICCPSEGEDFGGNPFPYSALSGDQPCGCCDVRFVTGGDPAAIVASDKLSPPVAKPLADRIDHEPAILPPVRAGFHQVPGRPPPRPPGAPARIRFCSFLL